jgi:hypothetical protein
MANTGKPQGLPTIDLSPAGACVLSLPPNDTDIVIAGDALPFYLNLPVTRQVMAVARSTSDPVEVSRRIRSAEDGIRSKLGSLAFTASPPSRTGRLQLTARDLNRPSSAWRSGPVRRGPFFGFGKAIVAKNSLDSPGPES